MAGDHGIYYPKPQPKKGTPAHSAEEEKKKIPSSPSPRLWIYDLYIRDLWLRNVTVQLGAPLPQMGALIVLFITGIKGGEGVKIIKKKKFVFVFKWLG